MVFVNGFNLFRVTAHAASPGPLVFMSAGICAFTNSGGLDSQYMDKDYISGGLSAKGRSMTHEYFMNQALAQAEKAFSAGEFPVGCVIADGEAVVAEGCRRNSAGLRPNEIDHSEILALRSWYARGQISNPDALTVYCTMEPCLMCFGAILISGIRRIVYAYEDVMGGGTRCALSALPPLYSKDAVQIIPHVLREQSLRLFQAFFAKPENLYWKDSLLAAYTLAQK